MIPRLGDGNESEANPAIHCKNVLGLENDSPSRGRKLDRYANKQTNTKV